MSLKIKLSVVRLKMKIMIVYVLNEIQRFY